MLKKLIDFIKKSKKTIAFAVVLLITGLVLGNKIFSPKKPKYQTAKAEKKDLSLIVSASGEITSDEETTIKFKTAGHLVWVGAKKGDKVKKWHAVAQLDKEKLQKELEQELYDYMNDRWDLDEVMDVTYKDQVLTEIIRIAQEKEQFDLDRTVLDVEIANIALKYSTLTSPIDGIITATDFPYAGINVALTDKMVISNPEKLVFSANVDEADIGKIRQGMKTKLLLDAYFEEEISTLVQEIEFTSTITSGGGTAFSVKFSLPSNTENEKFKLGMNGDVDIFVEEKSGLLVVPFEAIQEKNGDQYVVLITEKGFEKKSVETGFSDDVYTEIKTGLEKGDVVVISGFKEIERKIK